MLHHKRLISGYTLIELMVTVSVVAVLATVAVPNFTTFISDARERNDIQQLMKTIVAARSEAVVRARPVTLTATDGDWSKGWRAWADINRNGSYEDGETFKLVEAIKTKALITATLEGAAVSSVTFDAQGFIQDAKPVTFSYRSTPEKCSHDRDLAITASGQVTVKDRTCP